jgi:hypothetical protein
MARTFVVERDGREPKRFSTVAAAEHYLRLAGAGRIVVAPDTSGRSAPAKGDGRASRPSRPAARPSPTAKAEAKATAKPRTPRPVITDVTPGPYIGDVNPQPLLEITWE